MKNEIGRLIKETREEKKITITQLAKEICISIGSLSNIENGRIGDRPSSYMNIKKILDYLKVVPPQDIQNFLSEKTNNNEEKNIKEIEGLYLDKIKTKFEVPNDGLMVEAIIEVTVQTDLEDSPTHINGIEINPENIATELYAARDAFKEMFDENFINNISEKIKHKIDYSYKMKTFHVLEGMLTYHKNNNEMKEYEQLKKFVDMYKKDHLEKFLTNEE
ncbi:helix-turn-helix domain-containing protein [Bacillus altitudinis]|uniref:helix-turn-helix domain-containing protein n=1 Tax=Bacillus altitudinis TaxID=293387 RepID=UPI0040460265